MKLICPLSKSYNPKEHRCIVLAHELNPVHFSEHGCFKRNIRSSNLQGRCYTKKLEVQNFIIKKSDEKIPRHKHM